ncbi:MAG: hypothetical protein QM589_03915, partial [Thermomicrobiales bacterium]
RAQPRRELPRDPAPRNPEPDRNPFDDDLGAPPPPPPYEGELLTERPNRPSLRDRVRGASAGPSQPANANAPREDNRPTRLRPASQPQPQPPSGINESSAHYGATPRNETPAPQQPASRPAPVQPLASPSASGPGIGIDSIVEQWVQIRNDVKAVNRRTEALLQQVDPAGVAGDTLVLVSPYEFHRNKVNSDEARAIVEDVIQRRLNHRLTVTCVTREEAQAMIAQRSPSPTSSAAAPEPAPDTPSPPRPAPEPEQPNQPAIVTDGGRPAADEPVRATSAVSEEPIATRPEDANAPFDPELDEKRLNAIRNIFDAEDVDEDTEFV